MLVTVAVVIGVIILLRNIMRDWGNGGGGGGSREVPELPPDPGARNKAPTAPRERERVGPR